MLHSVTRPTVCAPGYEVSVAAKQTIFSTALLSNLRNETEASDDRSVSSLSCLDTEYDAGDEDSSVGQKEANPRESSQQEENR